MRLWKILAVLAATLSCVQLSAADAGVCHEWEAEVARLTQLVEGSKGESAGIANELAASKDLVRQYEEYSAKLREQADADKAGLSLAQQQNHELQEQLKKEQEVRASLDSRLHAVEEQLLSAQSRAAEGQRDALSPDERALLQLVQDSWLPLWAQRRLSSSKSDLGVLYEELKTGNTSRYGLLAYKAYEAVGGHALTAQSFVSKKLDDHAPGFKAQLVSALDALRPHASTAWDHLDKHVLKAHWFRTVQQALVGSEAELRKFLTHHISKTPMLAPYADPVVIQVLVYSLFALPLLLVAPVLSGLLASRRSQPELDAPKKKTSVNKTGRTGSASKGQTKPK